VIKVRELLLNVHLKNSAMLNLISPTVAPSAHLETVIGGQDKQSPKWATWVLPSIADVFFLVLLGILAFSPMSSALLGDADTGWHIRDGEMIWAARAVPHTDPFSYTRGGQPWYAWEWLYDLAAAGIHHLAGLNGLVLFTAMVIAGTFALLFRLVLRRSGSFVAALVLAMLAASAAQVHMLARPHVLTWLFTLLWVEALYRFDEGKVAALWCLPPLMLLWVNIHGGFILGMVLLGIFGVARIWNFLAERRDEDLKAILQLSVAGCACFAITFCTPYGYELHVHVYQYLSNSFLMNTINEFQSPNFHLPGYGYFEILILLSVLGVMWARERVSVADLLLVLFSIHASLYAARNIPISAILISMALGPALAEAISPKHRKQPRWMTSLLDTVQDISTNMGDMEKRFRGHAPALLMVAASVAIALNGGRVGSAQVLSAHFDGQIFPVAATEFIAQKGIHDHMFNTDDWSGYLIYKLYPGLKVYFDDRHDFYGESFFREYHKASHGTLQWHEPLDQSQTRWALIAAKSPLASLLKESKDWRLEYDDGVAMVFARAN
jgi:hypothetical protein